MKMTGYLFTYLAVIFSVAMMDNARASDTSSQPTDGRCAEKPELPGRTEHANIVQQ